MQNLREEKIDAMEQRKDDAKRWKKRYTKDMNIQIARMFYEATRQASLPVEQRMAALELVCKAAGVEMRKFKLGPYLEEMKAEIEISYPKDILAMIAEKKATAIARASSSSVHAELGNATPDHAIQSAQIPSNKTKTNSSALGK